MHVNTQINNDSLQKGLVGWWTFDGKDMAGMLAYDRSGQNNNGTLTNGPLRTEGKLGQALSFDGLDDEVQFINVAPPSTSGSTRATYAAWLYGRNFEPDDGVYSLIIGEQLSANCNVGQFSIHIKDVNSTDSILNLLLEVNLDGTAAQAVDIFDYQIQDVIKSNAWAHIAVVFDSVSDWHTLYVNGQFHSSKTDISTAVRSSNVDGYIGSNGGCGSNTLNGFIDDVRIYNRALTADEIKRLYRIGGTLHLNTQINNDTLQKGLVGWWSFDGKDTAGFPSGATPATVYDRSGLNNNGKYYNATGTSPVEGKFGQGILFNGLAVEIGDGSYVTVADADVLDVQTGDFTASAWLKHSNTFSNFVSKGNCGENNDWQMFTSNDIAGDYGFRTVGSAGNNIILQTSQGYPANIWHHVLGVKNGSAVRLYIDGVLADSDTQSESLLGNSNPLMFGTRYGPIVNSSCGEPSLNGSLDEVRLYNRALSADEIKRLYNLGR